MVVGGSEINSTDEESSARNVSSILKGKETSTNTTSKRKRAQNAHEGQGKSRGKSKGAPQAAEVTFAESTRCTSCSYYNKLIKILQKTIGDILNC